MKVIFEIAKNELKILFFSPVAWLMLVVFTVQTGLQFADIFNGTISYFALGHTSGGDLTHNIYSNTFFGFFTRVQQYLYLYIPLLTMGIMSRETSSGSIKLLFSSPINNFQVITGKYLSLTIYNLLLMLPLFLYAIFGYFTIVDMDFPLVLTGILGLYLLACAYAAIGLFMSGLTTYQTVAAIGTFATLAALTYVGRVGQTIPLVRDITYWLSITGRASEFIRGLISSEDLLYFFIISAMFLSLAVLQLKNKRSQSSLAGRMGSYVAVLLIAVFMGYLSSRPSLMAYYDSTRMKTQTLTAPSKEVLAQLKGKMSITTYANLFANDYTSVLPQYYNQDMEDYRPYMRFKPDMKMGYEYYYHPSPGFENTNPQHAKLTMKERAEKLANVYKLNFKRFLTEDKIKEIEGLAEEQYRFTRIIETADGRTAHLRNFDDMMKKPSESEITAAMKRLIMKPPKVGFLTDHQERSIEGRGDADYHSFAKSRTFRYALISQGFDTESVTLVKGRKIPDDIDILVIADPKTAYTDPEIEEINRYILSGRNLLIASKPGRTHLLQPLVEPLGVEFVAGTLVQESANFAPDLIFGNISSEGAELAKTYAEMSRTNTKITFPGVSGLTFRAGKGFTVKPVIVTESVVTDSTRCWNELETKNFNDEVPRFNPDAGEELQASLPLVLSLERTINERVQRIIVMGSADGISNGEFAVQRVGVETNNYALITESFRWFTQGEFPIDTSREANPDNALRHVQNADRKRIKTTFGFVIPSVLALMGLMLIVRRKNH
ncbi:MAG: Gldg family protein [Proteiniphilum sp.]|nr:Gldg family protein [Proteiniphilum sp.]